MKQLVSFLVFITILINWGLVTAQNVIINEWMSKNSTVLEDEDGDFPDWIELYNAGPNAINLFGFGVSDNPRDPFKWSFPQKILGPNEFIVLFCSDKNRVAGPHYHTNFKLSGSEEIVLTNNLGNILSSRHVGTSVFDISEGAIVDGASDVIEFYQSTPGLSNSAGTIHNRVSVSHGSGFYNNEFELTLTNPSNHLIRYTVDGSEPTISDNLWTGVIYISDQSDQPNSISTIPTTAPNLSEDALWEAPAENTFKGTCVRFRSFHSGIPSSHIINRSFFIHPESSQRYTLPVLSILTDSLNLFDYDSGIYVPGAVHDADPNGGDVSGTGNYLQIGENWERSAHVELIDSEGALEFSQVLGIRIHGARSRTYPQKSLRLYAREKYGEKTLKYAVFQNTDEDKFNILVLRNMGQDFTTGVAQDVLAHELANELDQATLAVRPVVLFINGEYWGIQNLRERYDQYFLAQFHDLDKDSIDMIENYYGVASMGDSEAFNELFNFLESNSLSDQSNYNVVDSKMDIADFIDNTLIRIFLGCYDWPGNNIKIWKEKSPSSKFRWLLLDNDGCISEAEFNSIEHATASDHVGWPNPPEATLVLRRLLENDGFKQRFISRMAQLLNTVFATDHVLSELTRLYTIYSPEYDEHNNRWLALAEGETLKDNYDHLMDVVRLRPCYVRQHFMDYFNLSKAEFPFECDSAIAVTANGLLIYPNPNSGKFNLKVPEAFSTIDELSIYDLSGKSIFSISTFAASENPISITANRIPSGIYVVKMVAGNVSWNEKLVIQKD